MLEIIVGFVRLRILFYAFFVFGRFVFGLKIVLLLILVFDVLLVIDFLLLLFDLLVAFAAAFLRFDVSLFVLRLFYVVFRLRLFCHVLCLRFFFDLIIVFDVNLFVGRFILKGLVFLFKSFALGRIFDLSILVDISFVRNFFGCIFVFGGNFFERFVCCLLALSVRFFGVFFLFAFDGFV